MSLGQSTLRSRCLAACTHETPDQRALVFEDLVAQLLFESCEQMRHCVQVCLGVMKRRIRQSAYVHILSILYMLMCKDTVDM